MLEWRIYIASLSYIAQYLYYTLLNTHFEKMFPFKDYYLKIILLLQERKHFLKN